MTTPYDQDKWGLVARLLQCLPMLIVDIDDDKNDVPSLALYSTEVAPDETTDDRHARWCRLAEAMELLAMVWLVDSDAWRQLLTDKSPRSIRGSSSKDGGGTPICRLFLPGASSDKLAQILDALFTPIQDDERSEDFRLAKASILAQETREGVLATSETLQISVELAASRENDDAHSAIVRWFEDAQLSSTRCKLVGVNLFDPNRLSRASLDAIHYQIQRGFPWEAL